MSKIKSIYYCQNCGAQSATWVGRCKQCGEWNTYVEERVTVSPAASGGGKSVSAESKPLPLSEIRAGGDENRIHTSIQEINRVLGGGIVPGSLMLLGGEPGIGKSTLLLQLALSLPQHQKVLYVSGEESELQLKMRADRLPETNDNCYIVNENNTEVIFRHMEKLLPDLVIIDSIQTLQTPALESSAGTISQIRETTAELQRFAKATATPVFLVGHITKDGSLAGPKILEHMVDVVLQFEGERNYGYRIVRAVKNRFGSISEIGIFEMTATGLREVQNPSEMLISNHSDDANGIAIAATMEGLRPFLIETQALVSPSVYSTPQRSANGFDIRRLGMLLAVLEKRCGMRLMAKDIFLNIAGGLRPDDPATDLAVVTAILSSHFDIPIDSKTCFAAEIGLSGEVRPVSRVDQRIGEAEKLGYQRIFISAYNGKETAAHRIKVQRISKIDELLPALFQN
ncbi:MAG: DNA repair protein RadA [Bacteroidales bacterium]|nr:DNA repair protein RadA [Bacteroidales bacterium]